MAVLQSQLKLSLLDQVSGPARRISGVLRSLTASAKAQAGMFSGLTGKLAMMTGGAASIYGVARGFKTAVSSAADFQTAMNRVSALSGSTSVEMKKMREQALELGRTTMFTASQAGDAQGFLAMAGFKANDILGAMPGTLQLATAAQMDLARTADVVTNILTGYNKEVGELDHVNDVLVKAFTSANVDLTMLAESMKYAGPVATGAGVQFEEATAALSLMGNAGVQGSMAGTSLRNAIISAIKPSKAARKEMKRLGLQFTDTNGRLLPFSEIVQQLEGHVENTDLMIELFGKRGGPAMIALANQGSSAFNKLTRELRNSGGTAERVANVQMQGFNGRMLEMRSAAEGFMIAWGDRIIPHLTPMVERFTRLFGELTEFMGTLDSRVSVLDRMAASFKSFAAGLGFDDAGDMLNSWRQFFVDGLFGTTEGFHKDVEDMGRTAWKMRQIGADIRAFIDDVKASPIGAMLGEITGYGFKLMLASVGFGLLAGAIMKLGRALMFLTGASAAIAIIKTLVGLGGAIFKKLPKAAGGKNNNTVANRPNSIVPKTPGLNDKLTKGFQSPWGPGAESTGGRVRHVARGPTGTPLPRNPTPAPVIGELLEAATRPSGWRALVKDLFGKGGLVTTGVGMVGEYGISSMLEQLNKRLYSDDQRARVDEMLGNTRRTTWLGNEVTDGPSLLQNLKNLDNWLAEKTGWTVNTGQNQDAVQTLESIREAVGRPPAGTTDVRVTNPMRPNMPINVVVHATSSDPSGVGREVGASVQRAIDANFGDSGGGW